MTRLPLRALLIGMAFTTVFAYMAVVAINRFHRFIPSTQISCLAIIFCLCLVFLLNPLLRLLRLRALNRQEIILILIMAVVPAGIPVFGYVGEVAPMIATLHHPEWNTPQSQWDEVLTPNLDPRLFLGAPLFQARDVKDWRAFCQMLSQAGQQEKPTPARHLWNLIPAHTQKQITRQAQGQDFTTAELNEALQTRREHKRARLGGSQAPELPAWEEEMACEALRRRNRFQVVQAVENALSRPDFYAPEIFAHLSLPAEARRLLARDPNKLLASEVKRRNRFLLEAAFPQTIRPSKFLADQAAMRDYVRGIRARGQEAWPIFLKNPNESFAQFGHRFLRYWTRTPALEAGDVENWRLLREYLREAGTPRASPALARMWSLLGTEARRALASSGQEDDRAAGRALLTAAQKYAVLAGLNHLIAAESLYAPTLHDAMTVEDAARDLMDRGASNLTRDDTCVLNRLLIEATLPQVLRRYTVRFFGEVPWASWIGPLAQWSLIAVVFLLMFYGLNELLFKQWYAREQLSFPVAQFSSLILVSEGTDERAPSIYRNPYCWLGMGLAFAILFYNAMAQAQWIPGMSPIDMSGRMDYAFRDTWLKGALPFRFHIVFSAIGLAFLLPVEISFSVWFFFLFMRLQQMIAVCLGYGVDGHSFHGDWFYRTGFTRAQGGGALVVFGLAYLWRVRHNFLAFVYRWVRPQGTRQLSEDAVRAYATPSFLFVAGSVGVFYLMLRGHVPLGMAIFAYIFFLLFSVAIVRLVAECGIICMQFWFGPFHVINGFGLFRHTALFAARGVGMILLFLQGFFLDVKAFVPAYMMTGKYLAERNGVPRRTFAGAIAISLLIALCVAFMVAVIIPYDLGLVSAQKWLYREFTPYTLREGTHMISNPEGLATWEPSMAGWITVGAIVGGGLMYLRQYLFWLPHPIGLILFADEESGYHGLYWFSFFIAWACKKTAIRYCTSEQYKVVRGFFIGLLLGTVLAVGAASLIALFYDPNMQLGLARS